VVTDDLPIRTARLDLHMVRPQDYELLAENPADPHLWAVRGFTNPHRHLVDDPGPLPHRIPRVVAQPEIAPYLLRMAVLRDEGVIIGSAGFHDAPDADGMVEIGLEVVPAHRGHGLAREMLHGMWSWVIDQPGVVTLRYTVSPGNGPSQHLVRSLGFAHIGVQQDDEDGPEDVFELPAREYRRRFVDT